MTGPDMHVSGSDKTPLALGLTAIVDKLDALVNIQRQQHEDIKASLDIIKTFGPPQEAKAARSAANSLHGGGDPLAGQIKTDPEVANGPGAGPVDPVVPAGMGASANTFGSPTRRLMAQTMSNLATMAGMPQLPPLRTGQHGAPTPGGIPSLSSALGGSGRHAAPGGGGGGFPGGGMGIRLGGAALRGLGGAVGGGMGGALGAAGAAAPYAAAALAAYEIGHKALDFVQNQREEGYRYQEIEGGSNLRAQRERFHEGLYARFTPGWSEGEARQAFMDVTAMGLSRRTEDHRVGRQDALNTMYHAKTTLGMSEAESAPFIQQAVNTTTPNLQALAVALREVSNAAGQAGVNAKMARQHLFQSIDAGIQGGMGYTGAAQNGQISQVYATWGRAYANISTDSQNDRIMRYRYAASAGMTPGQYLNMTRTDPGGAAVVRERNTQRTLDAFITPEMKSWIKQRVAQEGQNVSEATLDLIGDEFRAQYGGQLNPDVIVDVLKSQTGTTGVNLENWAGFVVRSVVGRTKGAEAAHELGSTAQVGANGRYVSGPLKGQKAEGKYHAGTGFLATYAKQVVHSGDPGALTHSALGVTGYTAWSKRNGGRAEPVIESLLAHVKNADTQKVSVPVMGKNGKEERRYMTLSQAINDYHNEVVAGKMTLEGDLKGKSYTDVGAMAGDSSRDWKTGAYTDTKKAGQYQDKKAYDHQQDHGAGWNPFDGKKGWGHDIHSLWNKMTGKDHKSDMGKTKLDLTDDAKKLLKILPGDTGAAAAEGAPPDSSGAVANH